MRLAAFMSGSGSNIKRLIQKEKSFKLKGETSPFEVVFVFSDRSDATCRGEAIAHEAGIPYASYDIRAFHRRRGIKRTVACPEGLIAREQFDRVASKLLETFEIDVIALGGYMSYLTLGRCVNVHPADLSIMTQKGERKYVGDHAVLDAIADGETFLRSSTLWTDQGVDTGPLLMVSNPVRVELPAPLESLLADRKRLKEVAGEHQERLKEIGDWTIFPRTVELIARGRFAVDELNQVYVDGEPVPKGFRE